MGIEKDPSICVTTVSPYIRPRNSPLVYSVSTAVSTQKDSSVMHGVSAILKSSLGLFKMAAVSSKIAFVPANH